MIFDIVGVIGVVLSLAPYTLLQFDKISVTGMYYPTINIIGTVLILVSLVFGDWNLSAALLEIIWLVICFGAFYKNWINRSTI